MPIANHHVHEEAKGDKPLKVETRPLIWWTLVLLGVVAIGLLLVQALGRATMPVMPQIRITAFAATAAEVEGLRRQRPEERKKDFLWQKTITFTPDRPMTAVHTIGAHSMRMEFLPQVDPTSGTIMHEIRTTERYADQLAPSEPLTVRYLLRTGTRGPVGQWSFPLMGMTAAERAGRLSNQSETVYFFEVLGPVGP